MKEYLFSKIMKQLESKTTFRLKKTHSSSTKESIKYKIEPQVISTGDYMVEVLGSITEDHSVTGNWNQRVAIFFTINKKNNIESNALKSSLILTSEQNNKIYNQLDKKIII